MSPEILENWIVMVQEHDRFGRNFGRHAAAFDPTARNCPDNPFAHNDLRAVRIRGVCPRGLIEA